MPLAVKILDYLYRHPDTSYRQALEDRLIDVTYSSYGFYRWFPIQWLRDDWLERYVRIPFDIAGGLPSAFQERWRDRAEAFVADLDANGEADYLVAIKFGPRIGVDTLSGFFWVHRSGGAFELVPLPGWVYDYEEEPNIRALYPTVLAIEDLNGDGQAEVAYTVSTCGASTCFERLRVLSWQDGRWKDLLVTGGWVPQNGRWVIRDDDGDGIAELVATDTGPGSAGMGPSVPYEIHFQLRHGEFVPVEEVLPEGPEYMGEEFRSVKYWLFGQRLLRAYRFTEAVRMLECLAGCVDEENPWVDYRPFALFRAGMVHALLDDVERARELWDQLVEQFPDHPLSQDVAQLRQVIKTRDDIWLGCAWLDENGQDWAAHEHLSGLPNGYRFYLDWSDLCASGFLLPLWHWSTQESLVAQMARFQISWNKLSTEYDLNNDGIPEPIGLLSVGNGRSPWVFLSQGDSYWPLLVTQPFPIEALNTAGAFWSGFYSAIDPECKDIRVTDLDGNHMPEVLIVCPGRFQVWEWLGHRFQPHIVQYYDPRRAKVLRGRVVLTTGPGDTAKLRVLLSDPDAPGQVVEERTYRLRGGDLQLIGRDPAPEPPGPSPLAEALEALFRDADPQRALEYLGRYDSSVPWTQYYDAPAAFREATGLYLKALALLYLGQERKAQPILETLMRDYPETGWAVLAAEKLDLLAVE